jgi:hypothetical protein
MDIINLNMNIKFTVEIINVPVQKFLINIKFLFLNTVCKITSNSGKTIFKTLFIKKFISYVHVLI